MFNFNTNRKTISDIYKIFKSKNLIVDDSYQRRAVWGEKDKIRLIETVLLNLVIPELFFWMAETDPETGESITHIVDGQQRINAIYTFINNEFKLSSKFLLDNDIKQKFDGKFFKDFTPEEKTAFWNYPLMIIDIDSNATKNDIINMFNRLNLTDYNLNEQEKRNSKSGEFAELAREISGEKFWDKYRLFSGTDIKRMKDVEFCASLIILYRNGIIDQTDQTALNQAYDQMKEDYQDKDNDKAAVLKAIDTIKDFFINDEIIKFARRKTQLYTLFSIIFYMQREGMPIKSDYKKNLKAFVNLYSVFGNDIDLSAKIDDEEKTLFDWLKKYKLASSEGIHKHTNRMIRYNVMKDFLFNISQELATKRESLYKKLKENSSSNKMEDADD